MVKSNDNILNKSRASTICARNFMFLSMPLQFQVLPSSTAAVQWQVPQIVSSNRRDKAPPYLAGLPPATPHHNSAPLSLPPFPNGHYEAQIHISLALPSDLQNMTAPGVWQIMPLSKSASPHRQYDCIV